MIKVPLIQIPIFIMEKYLNMKMEKSNNREIQKVRSFLEIIFRKVPQIRMSVILWNGEEITNLRDGEPEFRVIIKSPLAISKFLKTPSDLHIPEAYFDDLFDMDGDLDDLVRAGIELSKINLTLGEKLRLGSKLFSMKINSAAGIKHQKYQRKGNKYSIESDKNAISYHYDLPTDFFRLWLEENMVYSGAYFSEENASLNDAQHYKMDYICRKLSLKPGEKLLDIGCGWGSFPIFAAKNYGVDVLGVTLSEEQAEYANLRIKEAKLEHSCRIEVRDYRELENDQFDKISSIEMLHHVGEKNIPEYFEKIRKLLKQDGYSFQLTVTANPAKGKFKNSAFGEKYFMPDYNLIPVSKLLSYAENAGFEIFDVENVRFHYMRTAQEWLKNIEKNHDKIVECTSEPSYRIHRLSVYVMYMAFREAMINFYHFIITNKNSELRNIKQIRPQ